MIKSGIAPIPGFITGKEDLSPRTSNDRTWGELHPAMIMLKANSTT
jgi:hypothetical protein